MYKCLDLLCQVVCQKIIKGQETSAVACLNEQKSSIIFRLIEIHNKNKDLFLKITENKDIFQYISFKFYKMYKDAEEKNCFVVMKNIKEILDEIITELNSNGINSTDFTSIKNKL